MNIKKVLRYTIITIVVGTIIFLIFQLYSFIFRILILIIKFFKSYIFLHLKFISWFLVFGWNIFHLKYMSLSLKFFNYIFWLKLLNCLFISYFDIYLLFILLFTKDCYETVRTSYPNCSVYAFIANYFFSAIWTI